MLREFDFRQWLSSEFSYSARVIKDIVCRLNRANKLLSIREEKSYLTEFDMFLSKQNFSKTVKSQLKKSVKLYLEFIDKKEVSKVNMKNNYRVASLFSNIGVAEANLEKIGFSVVVANELEERRAKLYSSIYPNADVIAGDITDEVVFNDFITKAIEEEVDVLMATPPCQGMSTAGKQKADDDRNLLILPVINAVNKIKPKFVFIENVPMFLKTKIDIGGTNYLIIDYLNEQLSKDYNFSISVIDTSEFGVPQSRERAIILLTRKDITGKWEIPSKDSKKVTLYDAIGHLPELDPFIKDISEEERKKIFPNFESRKEEAKKISRWHTPPEHIYRQVEAMQHTKTGETAFDNEIYYPKKADGNPVRGYRNTYKRQNWDRPAYTVTMDNRKISSQNNVHPGREYTNKEGEVLYSDPRALTLYEIMLIMSLPDTWNLPDNASEAFVRRIIGEGIPPLFVEKVFSQILKIERNRNEKN